MSDDHSYIEPSSSTCGGGGIDAETALFLQLAEQLSVGDASALAVIVRRAAEICHEDGEAVALAVLDQIEAILNGEAPHA